MGGGAPCLRQMDMFKMEGFGWLAAADHEHETSSSFDRHVAMTSKTRNLDLGAYRTKCNFLLPRDLNRLWSRRARLHYP